MDFEKLGAFYIGKEYDVATKQLQDRLLMYDARDLTTHAVCVGMTGSGKTGLCIDILEEAAIDHVPAIIIDPKGDITNLLLTFPELRPENFKPWVNVDDARRKGLTVEEFSVQQAELWRKGLAKWGQDGERIRMLHNSADFVIYTPGSDAGVPVSILHSFAAPPLDWRTDAELLREQIQGIVSALLGLIGIRADPVRSREHILLSTLFEHFWRQGEGLDIAKIIVSIQDPPMRTLGVFDIDTFFPKKDRMELAMNLNNLIAAPSFQNWLQGQPLDIASFLSTSDGKPRHSIFYIAHLNDAERMFFVTILLNQVIAWMRRQPGTTSLRALLYMDEIFGFFPPVAAPPSKKPMLTLLKQARAFGLGIILTTQNPVDLDYKGLTNAGTWFIGRLQTERDKMRVLDGLESVSSEAGTSLNRNELSRVISNLGKRVFLLHNVHEEASITFQTRWAMSYLRGPLTRTQIRTLMSGQTSDYIVSPPHTFSVTSQKSSASPPSISSEIQQVYLPIRKGVTAATLDIEREKGSINVEKHLLVYSPAVLGRGRIHFVDARKNVNEREDVALFIHASDTLHWDNAHVAEIAKMTDRSEPDAHFDELPETLNEPREFNALKKGLADHLYRTKSMKLFYSPILKLYSSSKETKSDFLMRLRQEAREKRDEEIDKLEQRYAKRLGKLQDRLIRAEVTLDKKQAGASSRKREVMVSVGESVLGMFMGRRSTRSASTAMSKYRQSKSAGMSVKEVEEKVTALKREIKELENELKEQTDTIRKEWDDALNEIQEVPIKPRKSDIDVHMVALAWIPHWQITYKDRSGAALSESVPAY